MSFIDYDAWKLDHPPIYYLECYHCHEREEDTDRDGELCPYCLNGHLQLVKEF